MNPGRLTILLLAALFTLLSCKKEKDKEPEIPDAAFDKQAMLSNMADQLILPSYQSYKTALDSLVSGYHIFRGNMNVVQLGELRSRFQLAYELYQNCDLYEFGPAENLQFRSNCNVFPTDTVQILSNISTGIYDLNTLSNIDAKGFPALDFLVYGNQSSNTSIVLSFSSSAKRVEYVENLLSDLSSRIFAICNGWNSGYRNTFVNSLSTDVGSSIGYLINQINFQLDYLKNAKLGIPLGKKTLGIKQPAHCEAYYSARSSYFALKTLETIESTYLGRNSNGNNGLGFDDYLDHLKIEYNGELLSSAINKQFALAKQKLNSLQGPISTEVISNEASVDAAYIELVKLLVLLKTDMPSSLGVVITYQDGDGD